MPRSPRFIFQNAFYHVFNRGINKQEIFFDENDYKFFLKKLLGLKKKYDHSVYAYCLMPNHFHISIQTRRIPISKIMASLTTSFSMYFNNKYEHYGPVFQNRFKSILIENDTYFLGLSRYIYLNPVKARIVSDPVLYQFSSIRESLGDEPLHVLDQDITRLTGDTDKSRKAYRQFIYDGIKQDLTEYDQFFEKEDNVLGSDRFSTMAQKKYLRRRQKTMLSLD